MKHLFKGQVTPKRLNQLLWFTSVKSEGVIKALHMHLVEGWDAGLSARRYEVDAGNFSKTLAKLESIAAHYEYMKQDDVAHLLCEN